MANVFNFSHIPTVKYFDGLGERQLMYGNNAMIVKNVLHPGFPVFKHRHPHEQIAWVSSGKCEFLLNDEWFPMGPGDMVFIPSDADHDIKVLGDEDLIVYDIFSPIREDFIKQVEESLQKGMD